EKGITLSSKRMFDPEALTALQQAWEDRMAVHGVGMRQKRSRATHVTLKQYYGALENHAAEFGPDQRETLRITPPPEKKLFESKEDHARRVREWQKAEEKRLRDELRPLSVEAAKGRLYEAEKRSHQFT